MQRSTDMCPSPINTFLFQPLNLRFRKHYRNGVRTTKTVGDWDIGHDGVSSKI